MKTNLIVDAKDETLVQSMGAKRDKNTGRWYVEDVENLEQFLPWIPQHLKEPSKPVIGLE
jgi:hypothetical protein